MESSFESPVTMAGRHGDTDSLAGSQSLDGKVEFGAKDHVI